MTNATTPAGPPAISASALFRWEVPEKPVIIYLSLDLVDRLEKEVLEAFKAVTKRGSEIGGVLWGRTAQDGKQLVLVEGCEAVECEYARGPLYLMSENDRKLYEGKLAEVKGKGATVVGFFRSNTRRDVTLDDDDQSVAQQYHGQPDNVLLLVKPFAMKPSVGGFFIWEDGTLNTEASYLPFPFKRAELEKNAAQIVKPGDPALSVFFQQALPVEAAPAPKVEAPKPEPPRAPAARVEPPKVEAPPAPKVEPPPVAKAPEPPPAPKVQAPPPPRREEPKEAPKPPAPAAKEPVKPAVQVKKEEPPKREEPKREESRKEEPRKEEKPAAAAPLPFKREERAPITPMARPEQRPAGPVLVKKDDAAAAKADEKPAPPSRRDEKPAVTPVTVRGGAVAAPKEDLKPAPLAPPAAAAKADPLTAPAFGQPVPERILGPEVQPAKSFFANKWLWIALVVIVLAIGGFFAYRQFILLRPAAPAVSESLDLRAERNAGQLMVTWNREASAIQRAERATLSITDGDHKEDVDLDLGLLRKGSIIYTPLTNDVSFRLEVADLKGGKSTSEAVRVLAGRPSPAVGMPGTSEVPQNLTPQAVPAEKPVPQTPTEVAAAKPTEAPAPTAAPPAVTATPVVTAQPPKPESLASRLSAPVLEMPSLEGQSTSLPGTAVPTVSTFAAPPPTQAPTARPAAGQPPAQPAPRVGGVVQEARLLKRDIPVYPPLARQARVSGTVRVEAVIGTDGKVKSARALNGPPLLRQAATDSVKKWLYQPAMLNGQPTEVTTQVDLTFSPGR